MRKAWLAAVAALGLSMAPPVAVPAGASPVPVPAEALIDGVEILNRASGKCLEIADSSHANGARAQQWLCDGSATTMRWRVERQGGGKTFRIVNVNSGKCLEIADGSYEDGARAQQWECKDLPVMRWYVEPRDDALVIYNEETLRCLEIADSSLADGARAQQWACDYRAAQLWDLVV
ncbi:ricin-type beta-trefoil lectin protein [Saccharothrix saharensis]|uniref:Ricin-type beta-trefoil lectin protein n=1 Tax=Saccharothrix saharensis TaxID=571190 RepID=A0A543JS18_9PSEU|nr:RICIN domain-containing protein [Saccharothrix saharensis]TQM85534.1 ricin-type beta-trefoil lectin protein [Saccharothrix saharensis]